MNEICPVLWQRPQEHDRKKHEHDHGQLNVDAQQDREGPGEFQHRDGKIFRAVMRELADVVQVVGQA
jgi:hypothetical protein